MRMNIGFTITEKRKEKKITQEELADFIGVSKWETGQTYPDITSLPLLAAYFNVSIDSLLGYESQLNPKEIQHIYASLKESFETKSADDVLVSIRSFIRRYYSCYPFILQMGLLIMNHVDRLPGKNEEEKIQRYMNEVKDLFVHVRTQAKDPDLITKAFKLEAYSLLTLKEADQVLEILGEYPPGIFPVESLISGAFQMKGETERAISTLQSALLQYIIVVMSGFTNYLQLLIYAPEKFNETVQKGKAMAETFGLASLHPVALMNFQLSAAFGYAQMKEEHAALSMLEEFTAVIKEINFPVVLHGNDYFDQVDDWFNNLDIGNQIPSNAKLLKENFVSVVVNNPLFLNLQDEERFQQIILQLKSL